MATILVTGAAGFIGFHTARRLLARGDAVVGLDNMNAYYDPALKAARAALLQAEPGFRWVKLDLADRGGVAALFDEVRPDAVINLAAQAGVRYSLEEPATYIDSNIVGFLNILEGCRATSPRHLVFASTSSVFGANAKLPYSVHDGANHPLNLYAASKIANEVMAHSYAHLFGFPCTGLRFFTVYGPWGRPDMALFKFTRAILAGEPIEVYGEGRMQRDFTYVDDIVDGVVAALDRPAARDPAWNATAPDPSVSGVAPWRILNLGASAPIELMTYVRCLEAKLGCKADIRLLPVQPGEMHATGADVSDTQAALGYAPKVSVQDGVGRFVDWYRGYYRV